MASINVKFNSKKFDRFVKRAVKKVPEAFQTGAQKGLFLVDRDAKKSIQAQQSKGRVYKRGRGRVRHIASTPGNPPNTDTGRLVNSFVPPVKIRRGARLVVRAKYAAALENGTRRAGRRRNVRIEKRPYLQPAYDKNETKIINIILKEIDKAL